jgi:ubiquinone/menaquinone biosynthesis C-methylase UbiE
MIGLARCESSSPLVQGFFQTDADCLPLRDNCVDCVIIWRFLHHIRDAGVREAILREAGRVTRRVVLVSFHHPISFTCVRKMSQRWFLGKGSGSEITQWRLRREATQGGLQLVETIGFRKYVSINWFALLRKISNSAFGPT